MIEIQKIKIEFDNKIIFDNYSNKFEDNTIYAILGQSGCGKTTLLRIMAGLLKPQKGIIKYNDKIINKPMEEIFMMHQNYANFPWKTCLKNVLLPVQIKEGKITDKNEEKAKQLLNKVGLGGYEHRFPYELSGGMKQRLALARTLIMEPKVLLMDEPLSALDPKTRAQMQNLVLDLHYRTRNIIIMVTHDHDEAKKMGNKIIQL
ncbi:MAG: ABC transporter ATP-binding protein [archaeon]